jgi:hypothetical protein
MDLLLNINCILSLSNKFWLFIEYFSMQVRQRRFGWCCTMVPEYFWLQRLEANILITTLQTFVLSFI